MFVLVIVPTDIHAVGQCFMFVLMIVKTDRRRLGHVWACFKVTWSVSR